MRQAFNIVFLFLTLYISANAQILTGSNLPIIIVNTDGGGEIPYFQRVMGSMKIIYRGEGQRTYLDDQFNDAYINYDGRIDIKIRGNSTLLAPKHQYGLTTRKADGITNNNVSLLGMPPENDWILNGMALDHARILDYLAYNLSRQIGEYSSRAVYCELIINGSYQGLYLLVEKIKADDNRVNVIKIGLNDTSVPAVSGGYITVVEEVESVDIAWTMETLSGQTINYYHVLPKPNEVKPAQHNYIHNQFINLELTAQVGNDLTSDGFPSILDIPSFIHFVLINELASNPDAYWGSTFFHKDRNGKLRAGPIWDFDLAFGNFSSRSRTNVWQFSGCDGISSSDNGGSKFWKHLFDNAQFRCYLSKRWNELIQPGQPLNLSSIEAFIDKTTVTISEALVRDFSLWEHTDTHQQYISDIKTFFAARIPWMTANLGPYSSCTNVPVPPLVITKIMYHPDASIYSADNDDLEFIEITNNSDKTVDLTGIYFGGTGFVYQFPVNSTLGSNESIILASNSTYFQSAYATQPYGQFTRHLSNKSENLVLLDAFGNVIDNVHYSDSIPWPDADGNGYYLELSNIDLDNNLASSWKATKATITQGAFLYVSTPMMSLDYQEGSSDTLYITSNTNWTVLSSETWFTVSKASGSGNETITVTAQKNPTVNARNATVTIKATGLPDKTVIITQVGSPTGINDTEKTLVRMYPNPANTILFIDGLSGETQVSIFDLEGNLVLKKQFFNNNLDISNLASGVYTIKLNNKEEYITRKFVKN